jgi:hypothetical protein
MSDGDKREQRGPFAGCLAVALLLLPLLYVLSLGPAVRLFHDSNSPFIGLIAGFYSPLKWLAQNCQPIGDALNWYISLWQP